MELGHHCVNLSFLFSHHLSLLFFREAVISNCIVMKYCKCAGVQVQILLLKLGKRDDDLYVFQPKHDISRKIIKCITSQ